MSSNEKACLHCHQQIKRYNFDAHQRTCLERPHGISPVKQPKGAFSDLVNRTAISFDRTQVECQFCDFSGRKITVTEHQIACVFRPSTSSIGKSNSAENVVPLIYEENSCDLLMADCSYGACSSSLQTDFTKLHENILSESKRELDSSCSSLTEESTNDDENEEDEEMDVAPAVFNEIGNWKSFLNKQQEQENRNLMAVRGNSIFLLNWGLLGNVSYSMMGNLLSGTHAFLSLLSKKSPGLIPVVRSYPKTEYQLRSTLDLGKDTFETLAVCECCHANYELSDIPIDLKCINNNCATKLGRWSRTTHGKIFRPFYTYAYRSLRSALTDLLQMPDFESNCQLWKQGRIHHLRDKDIMYEVFDGKLWNSTPFQELVFNSNGYAFLLNFDFFPPFTRSCISTGCLYAVCMNLPAQIRFLERNLAVIGILPWIGGEPKDVNPYIAPLVKDLVQLWDGVQLSTFKQPDGSYVRAALMGTSSDMPATRKLAGFLAPSAKKGCPKCCVTLESRQSSTYRDYGTPFAEIKSGKLRDNNGRLILPWMLKTVVAHRAVVKQMKLTNNQDKISQKTGYKDSILLDLPYYDSARMHTIDPMHMLYEGIAKTVFKLWVSRGYLKNKDLEVLDQYLAGIPPPPDFDRVPAKISGCYNSFKAVQWMHFVLHYSPLILTGKVLKQSYRSYWEDFVRACRSVTKTEISKDDLAAFTENYVKFIKKFIKEHGTDSVVPNMHMAMHLEQCILDYGPIYGFWLFPFERYNGLLGAYPSNGHSNIESQLMRRFQLLSRVEALKQHIPEEANQLLANLSLEPPSCGEFRQIVLKHIHKMALEAEIGDPSIYSDLRCVTFPARKSPGKLNATQISDLRKIYEVIYDIHFAISDIDTKVVYYTKVVIGRDHFTSRKDGSNDRQAIVLVNWRPVSNSKPHLASVHRYFVHTISINEKLLTHVFAICHYHPTVPMPDDHFMEPVIICKRNETLPPNESCFVPIQRILARTICMSDPTCAGNVACVPLTINSG